MMPTDAPSTALQRAAVDAAQAATEVGTDEALSTAVRLLRAAADLTAMLHDDGSDPDVFVVPPDVQAAIDGALTIESRLADALDELRGDQHQHAARLEDGEGPV